VQQAIHINAVAALGLSAMLFVFAPWVMQILLSDAATAEAILAFRLAVVIYGAYSLNAVGYYVLLGVNAVLLLMGIQMAGAILALAGISLAARSWGLVGAIAGNAGYLLTWWLLVRGMKRLDLRFAVWGRWFAFPVMWYAVAIGVMAIFSPPMLVWAILWGGLMGVVLVGWFVKNERDLIEFLRRSLWSRKKHHPGVQL